MAGNDVEQPPWVCVGHAAISVEIMPASPPNLFGMDTGSRKTCSANQVLYISFATASKPRFSATKP